MGKFFRGMGGVTRAFGASLLAAACLLLLAAPARCEFACKPFIASWNAACERLNAPQKFRLEGDRAISAGAVIAALEGWCAIFTQKESAACESEIASLADEMAQSSFLAYAAFRDRHWRAEPPKINSQMNAQELALKLNAWLGVKINGRHPDYVSRETVETILHMNDFCAYFEVRRARLHRKGIDLGINSCQKLSTQGKYSCLDGWIDN